MRAADARIRAGVAGVGIRARVAGARIRVRVAGGAAIVAPRIASGIFPTAARGDTR